MPENVLSSSSCEIKLADLGVRLAPIYAPEVVEGGRFTKAADIWAFGCFAYEMVTGARPFLGRPEYELLGAILEEQPEAIPDIPDRWSPCLSDFIFKCFDKDP